MRYDGDEKPEAGAAVEPSARQSDESSVEPGSQARDRAFIPYHSPHSNDEIAKQES